MKCEKEVKCDSTEEKKNYEPAKFTFDEEEK